MGYQLSQYSIPHWYPRFLRKGLAQVYKTFVSQPKMISHETKNDIRVYVSVFRWYTGICKIRRDTLIFVYRIQIIISQINWDMNMISQVFWKRACPSIQEFCIPAEKHIPGYISQYPEITRDIQICIREMKNRNCIPVPKIFEYPLPEKLVYSAILG